jgi:hypothetical protein
MMKLLKLLFFISLTVVAEQSFAQFTNIMISSSNTPNEPSIRINPKNVAQIVAGANHRSVYISSDTGNTWQTNQLSSTYGVWGDPVIIADTAGSFYYFHLSAPSGSSFAPDWLDRIVCQKLNAIPGSWSNGSYFSLNGTKDQDKEWAVVDQATNNIYVSWTQFDKYASTLSTDSSHILFSRSTDAGASWSTPARLDQKGGDCLDGNNTVEGAVPAVGPSGQVYVSWAGPDGIWFDKSLNGGATWLNNDIFVTTMPGGLDITVPGINRCFGLPFTACDVSGGANTGNIYISWFDQRNGTSNTDVWFCRSTNGGDSWSAPVKVNTDNGFSHQFLSSMTVDQKTGIIYILFYDRRNYNDNRTDVYLAFSKDGGLTFHDTKISSSPFIPFSTVFFGDYTDISAHNGIIRPIWGRMNSGSQSIWTAKVDTNALFNTTVSVEEGNPRLEGEEVYPNPFYETTIISFKLRSAATVDLFVTDLYGRRIATLVNNTAMGIGKYTFRFRAQDHNLPPGIFYFYLRTGDVVSTRKIILAE